MSFAPYPDIFNAIGADLDTADKVRRSLCHVVSGSEAIAAPRIYTGLFGNDVALSADVMMTAAPPAQGITDSNSLIG